MPSLNETPSAERVHIGFFGARNAGKSSLINAITGQSVSVVSDIPGTTTDPVRKAMELLPLGPVLLIDTPGMDDTGPLGELRVERARAILARTDIAVLAIPAGADLTADDHKLIKMFEQNNVPYVIARTKSDLLPSTSIAFSGLPDGQRGREIYVSSTTGENIHELKEKLAHLSRSAESETRPLIENLVKAGDTILLIIPVDGSAPKGRLILPQQRVLREALELHCSILVCQPEEIPTTLGALADKSRVALAITDSQAFEKANHYVPNEIQLTSFSLLFARCKGDLKWLVRGASHLSKLRDGDHVLISEGCTHHRQCADIGAVKIPGWIEKFCGAKPEFSFTSGGDFPDPDKLAEFALVVHCGGCMLNGREMKRRMRTAASAGVPMVNYGAAIAQMHGVLKRAVTPFQEITPDELARLEND